MAATALRTAAAPAIISFDRLAGAAAITAALAGLAYSLSFVILRSTGLSAVFLMLGGLLATIVFSALHARLAPTGGALAMWALLLATAGSLGAVAHGGYDLANVLHPPSVSNGDLPNAIDPRGLATFGLAALGVGAFALLLSRDSRFPRSVAVLGGTAAALSLVLYLGRLIVLDATNPIIVGPALVLGFVVSPLWYLALGRQLLRRST